MVSPSSRESLISYLDLDHLWEIHWWQKLMKFVHKNKLVRLKELMMWNHLESHTSMLVRWNLILPQKVVQQVWTSDVVENKLVNLQKVVTQIYLRSKTRVFPVYLLLVLQASVFRNQLSSCLTLNLSTIHKRLKLSLSWKSLEKRLWLVSIHRHGQLGLQQSKKLKNSFTILTLDSAMLCMERLIEVTFRQKLQ